MTPTLSYVPFYGLRFEDFIDQAAARGFRGVELIPDQTPNLLSELDENRIRRLAQQLEALGLRPTVHSIFYDINLVSVVPEVARMSLDIVRTCVELAGSIGARDITVHPGYQFPGWRSSEYQREVFAQSAKRAMEALSRLAQEYDVRLFLENGSYFVTDKRMVASKPLHFGIDHREIDFMMEHGGPNLGICLDYGKAKVSDLDVSALISRHADRQFRFQIGSSSSLRGLISTPGIEAVLSDFSQVTYEGSADGAADFLTVARELGGSSGKLNE